MSSWVILMRHEGEVEFCVKDRERKDETKRQAEEGMNSRRRSHCCNETEMNECHGLVLVLSAVKPSWRR